ncbi:hypothetical protein [Nocardiopsis sp. YSL2]|uniref:hypothetical protein n=1 Tax=Nocardiopsis sp. YSL2 TaxID=2939492 RepID=UPI0026F44BE1|nr:hypothetical protein [Nocardiopsis sp. YSL2]
MSFTPLFSTYRQGENRVTSDEVVVVAASQAYPEYLDTAAYICQPGRVFQEGLAHMGFYAQQANRPYRGLRGPGAFYLRRGQAASGQRWNGRPSVPRCPNS